MSEIIRTIEDQGSRERSYFDIIRLPDGPDDGGPVFSNDLLDFWCPIGKLPGSKEDYDVGLCRIKKDFTYVDRMERHLSSVEIIIPVNGDLYIPVAPPGKTPDAEQAALIPVKVGEIITLHEGAWHFACGAIGHIGKTPLDYFVFLKKNTPAEDLEMKEMTGKVLVKK